MKAAHSAAMTAMFIHTSLSTKNMITVANSARTNRKYISSFETPPGARVGRALDGSGSRCGSGDGYAELMAPTLHCLCP